MPFTLTIHMASSLDGRIAKKDNSVSWFETTSNYEKGVEFTHAVSNESTDNADCYVMGARTYEHAVELSKSYGWPYGDTPTIVVTHKNPPIIRENIETYSGDLDQLVRERLKPKYRNVWVAGGPTLAREFINRGLADEIRFPIIPIVLGEGLLFFDRIEKEYPLILKDVKAFKNGIVELNYSLVK